MEIAGAIGTFAGLAVTAAQIYTKLSTLAYQIRFARDQILRIAQDVSGIEAAIQQLTEMLKDKDIPKSLDPENKSLYLMLNLKISCQSLFDSIEKSLKEASKQIKAKGLSPGVEVTLTKTEQALWPFQYDQVTSMLRELDAVKTTLVLVSQMTTLALVKGMAAGLVDLRYPPYLLTCFNSTDPRPKPNIHVTSDDKELLYRAIFVSLKDPQVQQILRQMSKDPSEPQTQKVSVNKLLGV
jgi:hypothetical protein